MEFLRTPFCLINSVKDSLIRYDVKKVNTDETVKLKFVFDSAGKKGNQNKKITIIVNDPSRTVFTLFFKGNVLP